MQSVRNFFERVSVRLQPPSVWAGGVLTWDHRPVPSPEPSVDPDELAVALRVIAQTQAAADRAPRRGRRTPGDGGDLQVREEAAAY